MAHHATELHFEQSVKVLHSRLQKCNVLEKEPKYRIALFLASHPEHIHQFRIVWNDDRGQPQMNRGFGVEYDTRSGFLRGPLRFHPAVNLDIIRFLGYEQMLKHALLRESGIGTFAAGADFTPSGKSSNEVFQFCNTFMTELSKYSAIAPESIFAEVGVSQQVLEWCRSFLDTPQTTTNSVKSLITDAEAAAYNLICYLNALIDYSSVVKTGFKNHYIAISGSGKLALATALEAIKRGATIVSLSDQMGSLVWPTGVTTTQINAIHIGKSSKASLASIMRSAITMGEVDYYPGSKPWLLVPQATIALPCAIENEIELSDAAELTEGALQYIVEGSTMSCTWEAVDLLEKLGSERQQPIWYVPSKTTTAASAGIWMEERVTRAIGDAWGKDRWEERLAEATKVGFHDDVVAAYEHVKRTNDRHQMPNLSMGSCALAAIRLGRNMKE